MSVRESAASLSEPRPSGSGGPAAPSRSRLGTQCGIGHGHLDRRLARYALNAFNVISRVIMAHKNRSTGCYTSLIRTKYVKYVYCIPVTALPRSFSRGCFRAPMSYRGLVHFLEIR